jgi:hypothetical protein
MEAAEAVATAARKAHQGARYAQKERTRRIVTQREEVARAESAIRSAQSVRATEQAQRDELAPFIPQGSDRVVARATYGRTIRPRQERGGGAGTAGQDQDRLR